MTAKEIANTLTEIQQALFSLNSRLTSQSEELLTVEKAAELAGIKASYLHKLLCAGVLSHFKSEGGKLTYIPKAEMLRWMKGRYVRNNQELKDRKV